MGQLFVTEFITVDGVMEDPGGSENMSAAAGPSASNGGKKATSSSWTR